jgi:hypothetical protein
MLSKKKGSSSRQPFTWKLSAIATQMAANRLPMVIQLQFFTQVFYYVGSQLWNTLLDRPELCTCNFGIHLKYAVSELRSWYVQRHAYRPHLVDALAQVQDRIWLTTRHRQDQHSEPAR